MVSLSCAHIFPSLLSTVCDWQSTSSSIAFDRFRTSKMPPLKRSTNVKIKSPRTHFKIKRRRSRKRSIIVFAGEDPSRIRLVSSSRADCIHSVDDLSPVMPPPPTPRPHSSRCTRFSVFRFVYFERTIRRFCNDSTLVGAACAAVCARPANFIFSVEMFMHCGLAVFPYVERIRRYTGM